MGKVLDIARTQIGVTENPAGSNRTPYGEEYGYNGVPWCCIFAWDMFHQADEDWPYKTASCGALYNWAKKNNCLVTDYNDIQPEDLLIYKLKVDHDHVGICDHVEGAYTYAIEGNTSATSKGSQDNGGMVALKKRNKNKLYGVVRMSLYNSKEVDNTQTYTVQKGDSLWSISSKFLGAGCKWRLIADANKLKNTTIVPGQVLIIPERT